MRLETKERFRRERKEALSGQFKGQENVVFTRLGLNPPKELKDNCACTEPTCPRHRGLVRDGKGAWTTPIRKANPCLTN